MGNFRLLLVMFLWAICFPLITLGIADAPHLTFAAMRAFVAGGALLAVAVVLGRKMPRGIRNWLALAAIGFGATTLAFFGMFHAAEFVSPGIATVIANTQPLMAASLAPWFLGERLNFRGKMGLMLGFIGIVLIAVPQLSSGGDAFRIGIGYIVVAAIGITLSNVIIKKIATRIDPLMAMGWQLMIGAVPLAIIAVATEDPMAVRWTVPFLVSLIGLSLAGTALAYWLWCTALASVELSHANAFTFLVPVFGLGMGMAFYQEQLSALAMVGVAFTLLGIYQVTKGMRPKKV
jgi:drug/metabolite transporter (DMT)-like permease